MPDSMPTFTGGCHCGLVRYECTSDLAMVTACNCSICTKKGLHIAFVDPKSFQPRAPARKSLKEYKFNRHVDRASDVQRMRRRPVRARPEARRQRRSLPLNVS